MNNDISFKKTPIQVHSSNLQALHNPQSFLSLPFLFFPSLFSSLPLFHEEHSEAQKCFFSGPATLLQEASKTII